MHNYGKAKCCYSINEKLVKEESVKDIDSKFQVKIQFQGSKMLSKV